jgi:phage shock protein E
MENVIQALKDGAQLIDVRTPEEFQMGHVEGTKNIPLQTFDKECQFILDSDKPVVLCCQSGMRSEQATRYLHQLGKTNAYNAGGWSHLQRLMDLL